MDFKRDLHKLQQAATLSDPSGPAYCLLSFIINRGEPMSALEWFRQCRDFANVLPSDSQFTAIVHELRNRVELDMKRAVASSNFSVWR
jgi:hypothetical protein